MNIFRRIVSRVVQVESSAEQHPCKQTAVKFVHVDVTLWEWSKKFFSPRSDFTTEMQPRVNKKVNSTYCGVIDMAQLTQQHQDRNTCRSRRTETKQNYDELTQSVRSCRRRQAEGKEKREYIPLEQFPKNISPEN